MPKTWLMLCSLGCWLSSCLNNFRNGKMRVKFQSKILRYVQYLVDSCLIAPILLPPFCIITSPEVGLWANCVRRTEVHGFCFGSMIEFESKVEVDGVQSFLYICMCLGKQEIGVFWQRYVLRFYAWAMQLLTFWARCNFAELEPKWLVLRPEYWSFSLTLPALL